jgi:hypothetical protein
MANRIVGLFTHTGGLLISVGYYKQRHQLVHMHWHVGGLQVPSGLLPVMELDGGPPITESLKIMMLLEQVCGILPCRHAHTDKSMHAFAHAHTHTHTDEHTHTYTWAHMQAHAHASMYAHAKAYKHVHTFSLHAYCESNTSCTSRIAQEFFQTLWRNVIGGSRDVCTLWNPKVHALGFTTLI